MISDACDLVVVANQRRSQRWHGLKSLGRSIGGTRLRYASDATDAEWAVIVPHLPAEPRRGRPRTTSLRAVVNAILYIVQTCCQWRLLPKEFPPFTTVQYYFYRWRDDGTWLRINHELVMLARERRGARRALRPELSTANR